MIEVTLSEIAQAINGRLVLGESGARETTRVHGDPQTDSREVKPGHIFFARHGEHTDGHLFVSDAVKAGAVLLVVERDTDQRAPQIVVKDATKALETLATWVVSQVRHHGSLTVVGITGSNGKTTTKNLVHAMAARIGPTIASFKSFNNEVGGSLTMLRINKDTKILVAEMGASAEGEIARLVSMAPPNIGVVLSVGLAHAGEFGSIDATARTKSEMVRNLTRSDVAVLNRDDPRVASMADLTPARVRWFGSHPEASVRAIDVHSTADGSRFTLQYRSDGTTLTRPVRFRMLGEHHVMNALAAAAVGIELGLPIDTVADTLETGQFAAPGRMEMLGGREGITIINDAYNASPDSMSAALRTLAQIRKDHGRTVAVLGAMSELGQYSTQEHTRLALQVVRLGIHELVVVGAEARQLHISAINEGSWGGESVFFSTADEAYEYLCRTLEPDDTVLVKSSNAAGLISLGDRLGKVYE